MLTRTAQGEYVARSDNPAMAAHFPGRPIVPGVIILQAVMQSAAAELPAVVGLRRVRFTRVLEADTPFTVQFNRNGNRVRFTVHGPEKTVIVNGELTVDLD